MFTRPILSVSLIASALMLVVVTPGRAEAQRRVRGPRLVRPQVVVLHAGYPRWRNGPWVGWNQWGRPYGYPPYPPYGYLGDQLTTSVRLDVEPREARVYVDGYLAGVVDDFDGIFQRLRLTPGPHDLVIFLEGYRTVQESLYLSPGADRKLQFSMMPLPSGEISEPPPPPADPDAAAPPAGAEPQRGVQGAPGAAGPTGYREAPDERGPFGTLALRVQPADAEVYVDGERWEPPTGTDRIAVRLPEGRHRVEVRKPGFQTYVEEVLIRRDGTLSLNVSLTAGPQPR